MLGAPEPSAAAPPLAREVATQLPIIGAIRGFLTGGNTLVRAGVIVLFFGVAFLLRYMAEHTHVPIEFRLTGISLGGVALAQDVATVVENRQTVMKAQGKDLGAIKAYLEDKGDLASAQTAGADLVQQIAKIPTTGASSLEEKNQEQFRNKCPRRYGCDDHKQDPTCAL